MKEEEKNAQRLGLIYGDYDYGKAGEASSINGHYSDKGKLPWHPTFSKESAYSTAEYPGGDWVQTGLTTNSFTPSAEMVRNGSTKGLGKYFSEVEPNSKLIAPVPYSDNIFK